MDNKYYKEIGKAVKIAQKNGGSLTEQNLLYVVKHAIDVANRTGADFDALLCEGVIAMMKYEAKYDPEKNDSFTKGAAAHINGAMLNVVNRQSSLLHIPVNHLAGFKKGQKKLEDANLDIIQIDSTNYDTLGVVDGTNEESMREEILRAGLDTLDTNGRIAMEMKLHMGKYSETVPSDSSNRVKYKYSSSLQSIADELEVPFNIASKIYKEALTKLSKYCQTAIGG